MSLVRCTLSRSTLHALTLLTLMWCGIAFAAGPPAARHTLSNGAHLIVSEQHALPLVVVQMIIDAGSRRDPRGQEGVANLTADLLTQGTKTRSASEISQAFDFIGASYGSSADTDYASLNMTALRKDFDPGLNLLVDVLLHPSFPEAEVARRREAALAQIKANEDEPGQVAERAFVKTIFPGGPYGHLVIGTPEAVGKLTRSEISGFYSQYYQPEDTIITVVGDVAAADVRDRLEAALRDWKHRTPPSFEYPPGATLHTDTVTINKPITQANIVLGQRGVARDNPDYYALQVMNYILGGGGFTSRLLDNIRTHAGLAYSVASFFTVNQAPGSFQVVMQTKNASANDAIQRACSEIARIRREPVGDEELNDAKLYLTGSFPLKLDSSAKIAGFLGQVAFFKLGADYADAYIQRINAVTKEDLQRVAQQYLHPEQMNLIVVTDLSQVQIPSGPPCAK